MANAEYFNDLFPIDVPAPAYTFDGFREWLNSGNYAESPKMSFLGGELYIETLGHPNKLVGIRIPRTANTLEGFTEWTYSDDYHRAEIPEYGLIDARGDDIDFQLLVWSEGGYEPAHDEFGWQYSPVLGRRFQLTRQRGRLGRWQYDLRHR